MTDKQIKEIRQRLDRDLSLEKFERDYLSDGEAATQFFQELFVQVLNFDETTSPMGDATWQDIPVHDWPNTTRANAARLFAESGNFRVIYVELEKLTRTAERNAIQSLTRSDRTSGWAIDGSFLTVFHAPDEDIWHLVTPYEEGTDDITTGRPVLRRYTLGEGETHRTVAKALSSMDAGKGRLAERIDEAFRVKPVTKDFYENYKSAFDTLSNELRRKGLDIEDADRYAHTTLNRLMFVYYLQKKGWIGDRKDFVRWFHDQYKETAREGVFHEEWLSALFFEGMNSLEGGEINANLPSDVGSAIADLPYMNGGLFQPTKEDNRDTFLSDSALKSVIEEFLEQYNFTVTEESPYDINVAVDPAMLGKIYESLIAEQERGEAGIFYTPRVEVDLMCRMALYEQFCEHANNLDAETKKRTVEFIFSEPQDWDTESSGETEQLENVLHELSIVDPACGSGAFLVGMKQVLTELYRKLGTNPDYNLKEQIINENLYGVDIKDWAVRVAEFRLWLSLVEGQDKLPEKEPVLPNFSFKLRTGDSIVQTIDGERMSMGSLSRNAGSMTRNELTDLRDLKKQYFEGESGLESEIRNKQIDVIETYIDEQIENLRNESTQQTLGGEPTKSAASVSKDIEARIKNLKSLREQITNADEEFFLWDLDFSEVMMEGGFDIVISNPPYVRGREIVPQSFTQDQLGEMSKSRINSLGSNYKTHLRDYVVEKFDIKPYKTSDLYLYFFFKGFDLLAPNGTLSFVTSNSWLNTKYGKRLQEGLLKFTDIEYIFDNRSTRTFTEADINTVITLANRNTTPQLAKNCSFISVQEAYNDFTTEETFQDLLLDDELDYEIKFRDEVFNVTKHTVYREIEIANESLWTLGGGNLGSAIGTDTGTSPQGTYGGDRWVLYHRAPDIYFEILNRAGGTFDELEKHVEDIKTGAYSGLNDFYYFETEKGAEFEKRIDDQFLIPFIRRPEQIQTPLLDPDDLGTNVFVCRKSKSELQREGYEAALRYIEWGENQERDDGTLWPEVPSVSGRNPGWWALPEKDSRPTNLFIGYVINTRFTSTFSEDLVTSDRCFHRVYDKVDRLKQLHVVFCSSLGPFLIELTGTANLGQGALKFETRLLKQLPTPNPDEVEYNKVSSAMNDLGSREIGSVFEEIGAKTPDHVTLQSVKEDRRAIDEYVLGDLIGLSESDQLELYKQIIKMVGNRVGKAQSV